jgi:hypothetical protein
MRKHPLIALTAFTALTASAIAGASTGNFSATSVLASARTNHLSRPSAAHLSDLSVTLSADSAFPGRGFTRDLVASHDLNRPARLHLSAASGLPVAPKPKPTPKPKPKPTQYVVVEAPAPVTPSPVVTTTTAAPVVTAPAGGAWYQLRACESGGNYAEDTGNGYYGAYQFALSTWYGLGFTGLPSDASPATQDAAAAELQAEAGWGQWPTCSAELGL